MDKMISPRTRKPVFYDSSLEDEKQPDAIIKSDEYFDLIKTTYSSSSKTLEFEGRPSFVVVERVNH